MIDLGNINTSEVLATRIKGKRGRKSYDQVLAEFVAGNVDVIAPSDYTSADGAAGAMAKYSEVIETEGYTVTVAGPFASGRVNDDGSPRATFTLTK